MDDIRRAIWLGVILSLGSAWAGGAVAQTPAQAEAAEAAEAPETNGDAEGVQGAEAPAVPPAPDAEAPPANGAQGAAGDSADRRGAVQRRLRVGVAGSPPFVFRREGQDPVGPAVQIWELIAEDQGWQYDLRPMPSAQSTIDAVEAGELDVAIGPISITAARANQVAFSQPYWQADLAIMAVPSNTGLLTNKKIMTKLVKGVGVLAVALCLIGLLMMLAERKAQSFKGFGEAVWFALVTMTTVGYGDFAPVTRAGRVIAGFWMLFAMFFGASLTAQIATALTLAELGSSSISSADDLRGRRVATKRGSTALQFAVDRGAIAVPTEDLESAVAALTHDPPQAAAVVFDRPALQYQQTLHSATEDTTELVIAEAGYEAQGYGFAFHSSSPLRRAANVVLLSLHEQGTLQEIGQAWINGERTPD